MNSFVQSASKELIYRIIAHENKVENVKCCFLNCGNFVTLRLDVLLSDSVKMIGHVDSQGI